MSSRLWIVTVLSLFGTLILAINYASVLRNVDSPGALVVDALDCVCDAALSFPPLGAVAGGAPRVVVVVAHPCHFIVVSVTESVRCGVGAGGHPAVVTPCQR
jgi:hypothetical protein